MVSIPAMRVRYISLSISSTLFPAGFNSRYAGKIHQAASTVLVHTIVVSIPAMRVRYIGWMVLLMGITYMQFQFPLCG